VCAPAAAGGAGTASQVPHEFPAIIEEVVLARITAGLAMPRGCSIMWMHPAPDACRLCSAA